MFVTKQYFFNPQVGQTHPNILVLFQRCSLEDTFETHSTWRINILAMYSVLWVFLATVAIKHFGVSRILSNRPSFGVNKMSLGAPNHLTAEEIYQKVCAI